MLLLRKIVHALLCFPALSPSGKETDGRKKASETDDEKGEVAAAFGDTGSSIRGERRMDMRPHSLPRSLPDIFRCSSFFCSIAPRPLSTLSPPRNRNEETSSSSAPVDKIDPSFSQATTRMSAPSWCCELRGLFAVGAITEVKGAPKLIPLCPYVF